jgi:hypothetical protein
MVVRLAPHAEHAADESLEPSRAPLVRDGLSLLTLALGVITAVVVFLPAEGRVGAPLHDLLGLLLGRATFMLPLGLLLTGALTVARNWSPDLALPWSRLVGLGTIALASLPIEHLLGGTVSGGLIGRALAETMLDWFGGPASAIGLIGSLAVGALLALDWTVSDVLGLARRLVHRRVTRVADK